MTRRLPWLGGAFDWSWLVCRVAEAEFEAARTAPAEARRWVAERLRRWELERWVDTAVLLTSELVTNVVLYAAGPPQVTVAVAGGVLEIGVSDLDPRIPQPVADAPTASCGTDEDAALSESGRGLVLIDRVADEWGTTRLEVGKHVWLRVNVAEWPHRASCVCHEPHPDRVELKSGRHVLHMG